MRSPSKLRRHRWPARRRGLELTCAAAATRALAVVVAPLAQAGGDAPTPALQVLLMGALVAVGQQSGATRRLLAGVGPAYGFLFRLWLLASRTGWFGVAYGPREGLWLGNPNTLAIGIVAGAAVAAAVVVRGPFLIGALLAAIAAWRWGRVSRNRRGMTMLIATSLTLSAAWIGWTLAPELSTGINDPLSERLRIERLLDPNDRGGTVSRLRSTESGIRSFLTSPLVGVTPDAPWEEPIWLPSRARGLVAPHNALIASLVRAGLVGTLGWALDIVALLRWRIPDPTLCWPLWAAVTALCLFEDALFMFPAFLATVLALAAGRVPNDNADGGPSERTPPGKDNDGAQQDRRIKIR